MAEKGRRIEELQSPDSGLALELEKAHALLTQTRAEWEVAKEKLAAREEAVGAYDKLEADAREALSGLEEERASKAEEQTELDQRVAKLEKEAKAAEGACKELLKHHPWMESERAKFGEKGGQYDFSDRRKMDKLQADLTKRQAQFETLGKRINKKVLSEYEYYSKEYEELTAKRQQVIRDKDQIEATIKEIETEKIHQLEEVHARVNADFGSIFHMLLPNAHSKLTTVGEGRPIQDGLMIKVHMGDNKTASTLGELSGGQQSLIALSLVLALLKFKPAPIYILDEVDSALDPSNSQNVGRVIKEHFGMSQFLIVSHKEGLFQNANVILRTKLDENTGHTIVARTVGIGAAAATSGKAPAAAAGRKAPLTARN